MHPPLRKNLHPMCDKAIEDLDSCHKDNNFVYKMFGVCNHQAREVDRCFGEEFEEWRKSNRSKGYFNVKEKEITEEKDL